MATQQERRKGVRIAGQGPIEAVVIDEHHQPIMRMAGAEVINVSGGGIAFSAATEAPVGATIQVVAAEGKPFEVRVLDCSDYLLNQRQMRCQLTSGSVPASLIYGW